jgi:hypothetical protein
MELTFELAEKFLAAQPFSVLLGARLTAFGEDGATLCAVAQGTVIAARR